MKKLILCLVLTLVLLPCASAHGGKTDADGGHYDTQTGEYHYHHGYSVHQHPDGVCPYEYDDRTDHSSQDTSSSSDSSVSNTDEYDPYEDDSTDGTYEEAFSYGMEYYFSERYQDEDWGPSYSSVFDELYDENYQNGETPLSSVNYVYSEAFNDGWYAAEYALQQWSSDQYSDIDDFDTEEYGIEDEWDDEPEELSDSEEPEETNDPPTKTDSKPINPYVPSIIDVLLDHISRFDLSGIWIVLCCAFFIYLIFIVTGKKE